MLQKVSALQLAISTYLLGIFANGVPTKESREPLWGLQSCLAGQALRYRLHLHPHHLPTLTPRVGHTPHLLTARGGVELEEEEGEREGEEEGDRKEREMAST